MLTRIVCGMFYLLWDRKNALHRNPQWFRSRFFIFSLYFSMAFQSCLSYGPPARNACTLYPLIGNSVFSTFKCCFIETKTKWFFFGGGGGEGNFSQFWAQIDSWSCEWLEVSGENAFTSKLQKKPRIWNTTDIFIKMTLIHLWCKNASWSLINPVD